MKLSSLLKRLGIALINIIVVVTITFFLLRLTPGDVVENMAVKIAKEQNLTMDVARMRVSYILNYDPNEPVLNQFGAYVNNILHGSLGYSMQYQDTSVLPVDTSGRNHCTSVELCRRHQSGCTDGLETKNHPRSHHHRPVRRGVVDTILHVAADIDRRILY